MLFASFAASYTMQDTTHIPLFNPRPAGANRQGLSRASGREIPLGQHGLDVSQIDNCGGSLG